MSKTPDYTVVVGKIPTTLVFTIPPPGSTTPGENHNVAAELTDVDGNPLEGKEICLYADDTPLACIDSDSYGRALFTIWFSSPGTYTVWAEFAGDDTYEGCSEESR